MEKSETLRDTGAAIGIRANGWRALDQLGVASELRHKAVTIPRYNNLQFNLSSLDLLPPLDGKVLLLRQQ